MTGRLPMPLLLWLGLVATLTGTPSPLSAAPLDLATASIVVPRRAAGDAAGERLAADVLREEIEKRTGFAWRTSEQWPTDGVAVAIAVGAVPEWGSSMPAVATRPEAYRLVSGTRGGRPVVWIVGADARGALFGVGRLLRTLSWTRGSATLAAAVDVETAPRYAIRGHQLGYRHHSNTYDGWNEAQYDQYVREIVLLGGNAVENIPFQDTRVSPLMPMSREAMNRRLSAICKKYGVDYWLWTPADFDLERCGEARGRPAVARHALCRPAEARRDLPAGRRPWRQRRLAGRAVPGRHRHAAAPAPSGGEGVAVAAAFRQGRDRFPVHVDRSRPAGLAGRPRRRSRQLPDSRHASPARTAAIPFATTRTSLTRCGASTRCRGGIRR